MKYDILLFDLDGTLADTIRGVMDSARYALAFYGIYPTEQELKPFFGPPLMYSFTTLFGLNEQRAAEAITRYREKYDEIGIEESCLYEGMADILDELRSVGYRLGVATSKYELYAQYMLKTHGIADRFEYICGSNKDESISKKHQIIGLALEKFGYTDKRDKVLMIGDLKYDILGAHTAGIDAMGVYTGSAAEGEHEKAGAEYVAHSHKEMCEILLKMAKD